MLCDILKAFRKTQKYFSGLMLILALQAPEIHRESISYRIVFWREVGQDQTCPKLIKI